MGRITPECIEQVAAANDIVDVIGSYFPLKKAGANWMALCPFHKEKSPSFNVNPQRQSYHCFGCHAGGGVIKFVMQYESLDYPSAIRKLAQRSGTPIIEEAGGSSSDFAQRAGEKARLLAIHRETSDWFHNHLMKKSSAQIARDYLKSRGITKEVAVRWKLGYAPDSWSDLLNFLQEKEFRLDEIEKSGLVAKKDNSSDLYDRFRGRLMFPICNEMGEVIAFSGRVLDPEAKTAKYVNSPETFLFSKGRMLFGLDKTKRALVDSKTAIVCEGQLDLITCYEAGVQNVIAPQGTAFTEHQARVVHRFAETVILCFDSDTAGLAAAERSLPALFGVGLDVRVAVMPQGEDPDSMINKKGVEAFQEILNGAKDFFDHAITLATREDPDMSPRTRSSLAKRLATFLALIDDVALRDAHLQKISTRLQLSTAMLIDLVNAAFKKPKDDRAPQEAEPAIIIRLSSGEEILLRAALSSEAVRTWLNSVNLAEAISLSQNQAIFEKLRTANFPDDDPPSFSRFLATLPEEALNIVNNVELLPDRTKAELIAKDCWNGILAEKLTERRQVLEKRLGSQGLPADEATVIQKEILDLTRRLKDIPRFSRWASIPS
ncbi:MAG: DNA primase [Chthoniobacterales bacterium]